MSTFVNQNSPKIAEFFFCKKCDYKCSKNSDYNKHLSTHKHFVNICQHLSTKSRQNSPKLFDCVCGKVYKDRSGLWRHKQKCKSRKQMVDTFDIIDELIKQNKELKDMMLEQNNKIIEMAKEGKNPVVTNHNTMNNNFNLNIFLNETCKDALNITDFVDSLKLQFKDLEDTGRLGYINGITKIFLNGLQALDISKRPIHCSDLKRETVYVKDQNKWEKDCGNMKLKKAIKVVTNKNAQQVYSWGQTHPEHQDSHSKKNDEYLKLVSITMGGSTCEEENRNLDKIAKNVLKEIYIDKINGNK